MKRMKREFCRASKIDAVNDVLQGRYAIYKTRQGLEIVFHDSYRPDILTDIERQIEKNPRGTWYCEKMPFSKGIK